jgi:hypothetical protein
MAIQNVWSGINANSFINFGAHEAGDLIIVFAHRRTSSSTISLPSGWTALRNNQIVNNSFRIAYRFATSSSTTSGNWSNTSVLLASIYRNVDSVANITGNLDGQGSGSGLNGVVYYPPVSMSVTDGSSWLVGVGGFGKDGDFNTSTPSSGNLDMSVRVYGTREHFLDTNGGVSASHTFSSVPITSAVNASYYSQGWALELIAAASPGFNHLDISNSGLINAASGSGNYLEISNSGYIRKAGTEGAGSLILDASGNIITKGS